MIRLCSTILRVAAAVAVVSVMLGCQERQLCYDHSHKASVSIEFDWSLAPEADPASMVVWFFPLDGSHGHRFELTGDGMSSRGSFDAVVKVPEGSYHMVCHNGSTEFNVERGSTIGDYQIETYDVEVLSAMNRAESAPRPGDTEMQAVRSQSSRLYAHTHDDIFTVVNDPKACQKVVFTPAEKTVVCDLRVTGVQNMRPDVEVSAPARSRRPTSRCLCLLPSTIAAPTALRGRLCSSACRASPIKSESIHPINTITTSMSPIRCAVRSATEKSNCHYPE